MAHGNVVAHWRCSGGVFGDVVAHRYVVAHWWRCGGSLVGDVVAHYMYCSSAPDFWSRGPGLESGISHNDLDALQDHCVIL